MTANRSCQLDALLIEVLQQPQDARAEFIDRHCPDPQLRHEMEELVRLHGQAGDFLEQPAIMPSDTIRLGPEPETVGTVIGRYKLRERIGEGGFGMVYLAEQSEPVRRTVAIKVIKLGMDTRQVIARFEAERQALAMMDHPHIARVLDVGATESGRPYFVMELVKGVPITQFCDEHRVPLHQRLALFTDVCHAVQHAHQKGIIHRDLKPTNVLVSRHDEKPVVKVIDFGIVKATGARLTDKTLHTEMRQLIGTPTYMSPEQAGMSDLDVDTRSDIYSLGVLLYELLTGTTPFDAKSLMSCGYDEMRRIIREVEPPKPSARASSLAQQIESSSKRDRLTGGSSSAHAAQSVIRLTSQSLVRTLRGDLDWIVMKCLEKDRSRRYETASTLALDIENFLAHLPVTAMPPSAGYKLRKFVRRNRGLVVAGTSIVATLLVATAVSIRFAIRESAALKREKIEHSRAEAALREEAKQRNIADQRADDRDKIAGFYAEMLSEIDPNAMGVKLRADLFGKARMAAERSNLASEDIDERLRELEKLIGGIDLTGIALTTLDENIFQRALDTIEKKFADQPLVQARLYQTIARALRELGLLKQASQPQERALAIRRASLGDEHKDTVYSINQMATLLLDQGKMAEAELYYREQLEKTRRLFGDEDARTLSAIGNMGSFFCDQGNLDEAFRYTSEALEKRRRVLGNDHPDTLHSINNMGGVLWKQRKVIEAEPYFREALEARRRILGDEDPQTLVSINNVAGLLFDQGKTAEAATYYREALAMHRVVLGDQHPQTLTIIHNLARVLKARGELDQAASLAREALESRRNVLGDEHQDTLASITLMAELLNAQGTKTAAMSLLNERLGTTRRIFGDAHPETLQAMNDTGLMLQWQGKLTEAEVLLRDALDGRRRGLGNDHADTLTSIKSLGCLQKQQGKLPHAEKNLLEALEISRRVLGEEHVDTLTTMDWLGELMMELGRHADAEKYFREVLEKRRRILGDEHPDTVSSIATMGAMLQATRRSGEAEPYLREAVEKCPRILGTTHEDTLLALVYLGVLLFEQNKLAEAEQYFLQAVEISPQVQRDTRGSKPRAIAAMYLILKKQGRLIESSTYYARVLSMKRARWPAGSEKLAATLAEGAMEFMSLQDFDRAESVLRECLEIRQRLLPDGNQNVWLKHNAASMLGEAILRRVKEEIAKTGSCNMAGERLGEAERLLLDAWEKLKDDPAVPPATPQMNRKREALERIVTLYDTMHEIEPRGGYAAHAEIWRKKLQAYGQRAPPESATP